MEVLTAEYRSYPMDPLVARLGGWRTGFVLYVDAIDTVVGEVSFGEKFRDLFNGV